MHISKSVLVVVFAILSTIGVFGLFTSHPWWAWFGGMVYGAGILATALLWAARGRR